MTKMLVCPICGERFDIDDIERTLNCMDNSLVPMIECFAGVMCPHCHNDTEEIVFDPNYLGAMLLVRIKDPEGYIRNQWETVRKPWVERSEGIFGR